MNIFKNIFQKPRIYSYVSFALICLIYIAISFFMPKPASATDIRGNWVPTNVETVFMNRCTQSRAAGSGYTIHAAFPNPTTITTSTGTSSTNLYAASIICTGAGYTSASNINISVTGFNRYAGTGDISIGSLPSNYSLGSLTTQHHFTNSLFKTAALTNLSGGLNCWTVLFTASATYGGFVDSGNPGLWNFCVNVTYTNWDYQPSVTRAGTTNGATSTTVAPGGEVIVNGNTVNAGVYSGVAFNFRMRPLTAHASNVTLVNNSWNYPSSNTFSSITNTTLASQSAQTVQWGSVDWGGGGITAIPAGGTSPQTRQARWRVNSTVPDGTNICFQTQVSNYNNAGSGNIWRGVLAGSYACFTVVVPPPLAALDGVKIDDSGADFDGTSTPAWGGNCNVTSGAPSHCASGSLATYPFSDNCVKIDGGSCYSLNSFDTGLTITPGTRTVSIQEGSIANDGTWTLEGYKICADGGTCTTQWLTTTPLSSASGGSFPYTFVSGVRYHMRWIYERLPLKCSSEFTTIEINTNAIFTADGGNSLYSWATSPAGTPPSLSVGGSFTTRWTDAGIKAVTVTSSGLTATCTIKAVTKPFFTVNNGDIATGLGACTGWGSSVGGGTLTSWNLGDFPMIGARTNLAIYALGIIDGVGSNKPSGNPKTFLSFANNPPGAYGYGGNFGGGISCPTDYYAAGLNISNSPGISVNVNLLAADSKYTADLVTVNGGGVGVNANVTNKKIALFIEGDVNLNSNIFVASGATYGTLSNFYLVVRGNIYIHANVTTLEGVYIAQPLEDGTKGKIYTCSLSGIRLPPIAAQLNGSVPNCQNQLTVNGAFIAKELKLYRSNGTLNTNIQAERFFYTPSVWLAVPDIFNTPFVGKYDSITSLPPVL